MERRYLQYTYYDSIDSTAGRFIGTYTYSIFDYGDMSDKFLWLLLLPNRVSASTLVSLVFDYKIWTAILFLFLLTWILGTTIANCVIFDKCRDKSRLILTSLMLTLVQQT